MGTACHYSYSCQETKGLATEDTEGTESGRKEREDGSFREGPARDVNSGTNP